MGKVSPSNLAPPEKLCGHHDTSAFDCGVASLNDWLKRRALANQVSGASKTYVVCSDGAVVGYYALAAGAVSHEQATGSIKRNMPDPIPVMVLGRLAVDQRYQGMKIGAGLLRDAVLRTLSAADIVGIRAILLHAISEEAKAFYEQQGFQASPLGPMVLMKGLSKTRDTFLEDP